MFVREHQDSRRRPGRGTSKKIASMRREGCESIKHSLRSPDKGKRGRPGVSEEREEPFSEGEIFRG